MSKIEKIYFRPCAWTLEKSMSKMIVFDTGDEFLFYMEGMAKPHNVKVQRLIRGSVKHNDIGWSEESLIRIGENVVGYFAYEEDIDVKKMNEYLKSIGVKTDGTN